MILTLATQGGGLVFPEWVGELAFGSVVVMALLGFIWFKPAVDQLRIDKEKAETQRDALIQAYQEQIIPALRDATVAVSKVTQVATSSAETNTAAAEVLREVRNLLLARREGT